MLQYIWGIAQTWCPPDQHKLCIRPESCHAHSSGAKGSHHFTSVFVPVTSRWNSDLIVAIAAQLLPATGGRVEQMEGQMGQRGWSLLFLQISYLHGSHRACRGVRQVEMIISIRNPQSSPLILEHGGMEPLSKNPSWTSWILQPFLLYPSITLINLIQTHKSIISIIQRHALWLNWDLCPKCHISIF